jgi:hypothetical protein
VTAIFAGDETSTGDDSEGGEGGASSAEEERTAEDAVAAANSRRRCLLSVAAKSAAAAEAPAVARADLRVAAVAAAAPAAVSAAAAEKAAAEKAAAVAGKAVAAASRAAELRRQADLLTAKSAAAAEAAAAAVKAAAAANADLAAASAAAPVAVSAAAAPVAVSAAAISAAACSGHGGGQREDRTSGGSFPQATRAGPFAGRGHPQPFFNYPRADAESCGLPSAPSSVFHHIFDTVVDWFSSKFSTEGLPVPRLWSDVSDGHLQIMHSTMADLHSKADERYVDFSKLPVDRSSWDFFLDKAMLNDECVDWMAKMLCQAVGSTMPGAETETVSPMLEISTQHSGRYVVLGVLHAESLRRLGQSQPEDLTPVLRILVGKGNVGEALARRLDPFSSKDLLVLQTRRKHTSLVELTRSRSSVDGWWSLCIHDTNNGHPQLDPDLKKGINLLLNATGPERAGAKTRLGRTYPPVYIQQKDGTVCGLTTFINLVQKLTGEVLDPHYWPLFVDLVRLFFDIWIQTRIGLRCSRGAGGDPEDLDAGAGLSAGVISAPLWAAGGGAMEQGGASAGPAVPSAGEGGVLDMALTCRVGITTAILS